MWLMRSEAATLVGVCRCRCYLATVDDVDDVDDVASLIVTCGNSRGQLSTEKRRAAVVGPPVVADCLPHAVDAAQGRHSGKYYAHAQHAVLQTRTEKRWVQRRAGGVLSLQLRLVLECVLIVRPFVVDVLRLFV